MRTYPLGLIVVATMLATYSAEQLMELLHHQRALPEAHYGAENTRGYTPARWDRDWNREWGTALLPLPMSRGEGTKGGEDQRAYSMRCL